MSDVREQTKTTAQARAAGYASLLVHAEPNGRSTQRVQIAARLAREMDARLIGIGAENYQGYPVGDPGIGVGYPSVEWTALMQEAVDQNLAAAEVAFRHDAAGAEMVWRAFEESPLQALCNTARAADLIVVNSKPCGAPAMKPGDLVMASGRPVLIVPETAAHLRARTVVIAWKNSREARRAVADAMPFLQRAQEVIVLAVCGNADTEDVEAQTDDVAAMLSRHQVNARALVTVSRHERVLHDLAKVARDNQADLIVAGAYGHSRAAEWAFGGVTDDLIHAPPCFVLLSH